YVHALDVYAALGKEWLLLASNKGNDFGDYEELTSQVLQEMTTCVDGLESGDVGASCLKVVPFAVLGWVDILFKTSPSYLSQTDITDFLIAVLEKGVELKVWQDKPP